MFSLPGWDGFNNRLSDIRTNSEWIRGFLLIYQDFFFEIRFFAIILFRL